MDLDVMMGDRIKPPGIQYSNLIPEGMSADIRLVKFTPTSTITQARQSDIIKFQIQNAGYIDPFSTYMKFQIEVDDLQRGEMRWLDRSAHSFIQRLVIRSNGVEIERMENYSVVAAMINDAIYSGEQMQQHHWEGFPSKHIMINRAFGGVIPIYESTLFKAAPLDASKLLVGSLKNFDDALPVEADHADFTNTANVHVGDMVIDSTDKKNLYYSLLYPGAMDDMHYVGEHCFFNSFSFMDKVQQGAYPFFREALKTTDKPEEEKTYLTKRYTSVVNEIPINNYTYYDDTYFCGDYPENGGAPQTDWFVHKQIINRYYSKKHYANSALNKQLSICHQGWRLGKQYRMQSEWYKQDDGSYDYDYNYGKCIGPASRTREFIIPFYSGFFGVLMPQKKFIPNPLIPLDIEISLNPYALYSSHSQQEGGKRNYKVTRFEIISHVLFFDSAVDAQLEAQISSQGLYLHCNSFFQCQVTPTTQNSRTVPNVLSIGTSLQSINSIFLLFYYNQYESEPQCRMLNFMSHNIKSLQIKNNVHYYPSEPITSMSGGLASDTYNFSHIQFLVETLKAWGRLHNPKLDSMLTIKGWGQDIQGPGADCMYVPTAAYTDDNVNTPFEDTEDVNTCSIAALEILKKQVLIGRTQYAISLEGEELGEEKRLITGRPARLPFDIYLQTDQTGKSEANGSYAIIFARYDYVVSINDQYNLTVSGR